MKRTLSRLAGTGPLAVVVDDTGRFLLAVDVVDVLVVIRVVVEVVVDVVVPGLRLVLVADLLIAAGVVDVLVAAGVVDVLVAAGVVALVAAGVVVVGVVVVVAAGVVAAGVVVVVAAGVVVLLVADVVVVLVADVVFVEAFFTRGRAVDEPWPVVAGPMGASQAGQSASLVKGYSIRGPGAPSACSG